VVFVFDLVFRKVTYGRRYQELERHPGKFSKNYKNRKTQKTKEKEHGKTEGENPR